MNALAKVTSKGQVTIPAEVRKALHIEEGDILVFDYSNGVAAIQVIKRRPLSSFRGSLASKVRYPGKQKVRAIVRNELATRTSRK